MRVSVSGFLLRQIFSDALGILPQQELMDSNTLGFLKMITFFITHAMAKEKRSLKGTLC